MMQHTETIHGYFRRALLMAALFALLVPSPAQALPPKYFSLTNPRIEIVNGALAVKLGIGFDHVTGLYEMLKDGATVELVVSAKLERVRALWSNVTLMEKECSSALEHNPLTREFSLYLPGESKPLLDKNLDRLLDATWEKFELVLGPLALLDGEQKGTEYRMTLHLALRHAKVPPWLVKNFMFWSKDIVDPETITLPFTH